MTSRRTYFPTGMAVGSFRLATMRRRSGYTVIDTRTGRAAYTQAHPISGRPIPALDRDVLQVLRIAAMLDQDERTER